ncbi:MAG: 1-(5-phosphoribosyl)-5-[(5-phosphoribosylamino)methylideneamino]imidazole-4-carboxamide isomerase [Kordiimonadaceae bacterium]|nr:1-(5-phosphoribosyl)-5-[(5-phosphoribosylamino)methylideneamino]imidazole-4-carboxamide isomerase [Kordiimonadaceae bacterium]MBO6568298.1 1-(5-phosphoribosyl)-5-[(5-phosphoribosylamino)methylideneamino]imidazole-4-carboxamide isomerase [Kordiimonadaceae bacterium]MBO6963972.1 1-(5-phosphoribosyl)-5-[(5-phosphoribosylamino)methylideneamino]imidazole-4-carboxamide isomerase [Kordiimonadaceae bacterium]
MTLYPAIDLKDGNCVRLFKGDMEAATVFNDNPAAQAKAFEDAGCRWLHIVDLNGAFAGEPVNGTAVDAIMEAVNVPVQLGGGIRDIATMDRWLDKGLSRLILGTLAVKNPALVKEACALFPGKIAVGIDAKGGKVAVEGWAEASELGVIELAQKFEDAGVAAIIHTDIDRDGTLTGVNAEASSELAASVSIPVIASGGVKDLSDIERVVAAGNLEGVITGRAIYDGGMDLEAALKIAAGDG